MSEDLKRRLHSELLATIPLMKSKGLKPSFFANMLNELGGYKTAKTLIGKREASQGFTDLLLKDLSVLSVEHIVLKDEYKTLFTKEELIIFITAILVLLYFSAFGIYYFEHEVQPAVYASIFDALWWAVVTLTTVGYGDMYPITVAGRIFTFIILMLGLVFIAVPTGIVASALSAVRREDEETEKEKQQENKR